MTNRPTWWRTGAGVTAWVVFALAATAVAWAAVGVVRGAATPPAVPAPAAGTAATPAQSTPPPPDSSPTSSSPGDAATAGAPRTVRSTGGTVAVSCRGDALRLLYATPEAGWQVVIDDQDEDRVDVEFHRGEAEAKVSARCRDGVVDAEVE
jgi:hypothetical protein